MEQSARWSVGHLYVLYLRVAVQRETHVAGVVCGASNELDRRLHDGSIYG